MKKIILIFISIILSVTCIHAGNDRTELTYGVEWGYKATIFTGGHANFFAPDGHREDLVWNVPNFYANSLGCIHVGMDINDMWNLSAYFGYAGIADYHHSIPISIRLTRFFAADSMADRWLSFIDAGSGISIKKDPEEIFSGKIGAGYRISLSKDTKLDFLAAGEVVMTHPEINYYGTIISADRINRNNGYVASISLSISLTF